MEFELRLTVTLVIAGTGFTVTMALPDLVVSSVEVAVIVAVPVAAGVNSPELEIVPMDDGLTDHVTPLLNAPVPVTVAVACEVCAVVIEAALIVTDTLVIVGGGTVTVTWALPDFVVSSVDVAVMVAVPVVAGVNSPVLEIVPMPAGLTDHVTALLYAPVPSTVAVACTVCAVVIVVGFTVTVTEVMVGSAAPTATAALPDFVASSTEVAVMVAVPVVAGVNTPALVIDPMLEGLTDHVTAVLKLPVPSTIAVACAVCAVVMEVGFAVTTTEVIVGVPPPVQFPHAPHPTANSAHTTAPNTHPAQRIARIAFSPSANCLDILRNCTWFSAGFLCAVSPSRMRLRRPGCAARAPTNHLQKIHPIRIARCPATRWFFYT